jgi:hypothetical protein
MGALTSWRLQRLMRWLVIPSLLALTLGSGAVGPAPAAASGNIARPVLAMYYAWFDSNSWGPSKTSFQPSQPYSSADRGTIERQVGQAQGAGIDAFELDWWGPGNQTDSNLQTLLSVASQHGFGVTVDFDLNSPFIHSTGDTINNLNYLKRYFGNPAWFQMGGKPVVVFFGIHAYDVATWGAIRAAVDPNHDEVWIGEGDQFNYLQVFDGIHPYSVAWSPDPSSQLASYASRARAYPGKLWMATVMPGYDDTLLGRSNGFAVDRQNGSYYASMWQGAIATSPDLISITSFNEWPEGDEIEPGVSYGDQYLTLTKQGSQSYKALSAGVPPASPASGKRAFYTQAGGGLGGFAVSDDAGIGFYTSFQGLGGVAALGYPATQRFQKDGFTYQATQGAVMQWRPELNQAILANAFDWFTESGQDDTLLNTDGIPKPIQDDGSNGNFAAAKQTRLQWLTDDAIATAYTGSGSLDAAIDRYGLPQSRPEKHGPFVVQRFQRIAFQHWVENVSGMPPSGSVVRILAGDLLKQTGVIPADAQTPSAS